jgi:hypothetical protein
MATFPAAHTMAADNASIIAYCFITVTINNIAAPVEKRSIAKNDGEKNSLATFMTTQLKPHNRHNNDNARNTFIPPCL